MKKIAFLLLPFAFVTQAQETQSPDKLVKKAFNTDYVNAANNIDSSRYCLYKDVLYTENAIVKMEDIMMQCKNASIMSNEKALEWRRYQ